MYRLTEEEQELLQQIRNPSWVRPAKQVWE